MLARSRSSKASSATSDALETADRVQPADLEAKTDRLQEKIGKPLHDPSGIVLKTS